MHMAFLPDTQTTDLHTIPNAKQQAQGLGGLRGDLVRTMIENDSDLEEEGDGREKDKKEKKSSSGKERSRRKEGKKKQKRREEEIERRRKKKEKKVRSLCVGVWALGCSS